VLTLSISIENVKQKQEEMLEKLARIKKFQRPIKHKSRPFYAALYYHANIEAGRFVPQLIVADLFLTMPESAHVWIREIDKALGIDTKKRFTLSRGKMKQKTEKKIVDCPHCKGTGKIMVEVPVGDKPENPDYYGWREELETLFLQGLIAVGQTVTFNGQTVKLLPKGWKQVSKGKTAIKDIKTEGMQIISKLPDGWAKTETFPWRIQKLFTHLNYKPPLNYLGDVNYETKVENLVAVIHIQVTPIPFDNKQRFVVVTGKFRCHEENAKEIAAFDCDPTNWKEAMWLANQKALEYMQKNRLYIK